MRTKVSEKLLQIAQAIDTQGEANLTRFWKTNKEIVVGERAGSGLRLKIGGYKNEEVRSEPQP